MSHTRHDDRETIAAIRAKEEWERAFASLPDLVAILDNQHRILRVNEAMARRIGVSAEECIGMLCYEAVHGLSEPPDFCPHSRMLKDGTPHREEVHEERLRGDFIVTVTPLTDEKGATIGAVHVAHEITERKRAEMELRESEAMLARAQQMAHVGHWYREVSTGKGRWSDETYRIFGLKPQEYEPYRQFFLEHVHHDDRVRVDKALSDAGDDVRPYNEIFRVVRPDGSVRWVHSKGEITRNPEGKPEWIFGTILDITERKQMEDALRQSESSLRAAQRIAHIGSWEWDIVKDAARWSDETFRIFGIYPVDLGEHRRGFLCYVHPEDRKRVDKALSDALTGTKEYDLEYRIILPDNSEKIIYSLAEVVRDSGGRPRLMRGTVHDITERKGMEDELRRSRDELELRVRERTAELEKERRRFYEVLETLSVMITLLTPDHQVVFANRALRDRFGEFQGRRCYEYIYGQKEPCGFCEAFKVLETGEPHHWECRVPDDRVFDVYDFPFTDVDGSPLVLEMDIDITENKRAEENRIQLKEQLHQSHKMQAIGTLAGGIAHDFNNLLAVIIGNTELAIDEVRDGDAVRHNLLQIFKASKRGRDLVKQILQFSRKSDRQRKPTDIIPVVKETFRLLRSSIPTSVEMKVSLLSGEAATLADPSEIQQILMNLATNAEHAMREHGGTLTFHIDEKRYAPGDSLPVPDLEPGPYVTITVRDTGAGMTVETKKRLFDPFFTTKDVGEGTGMGLATVYAIARDLNGAIAVSSKPGKGSTFRIFLPKVNAKKQEDDTQHTGALEGGHERILLVDDEEAVAEADCAILEHLGYQVTAITDSKEALELFSKDPMKYDIVITDEAMPRMTGIRLATEMIKIRHDIPVILCTGHSPTASPEKAKKAGISEFIMKPVTKKQLAEVIRRVLDA